jgi:ArsR family transcriptional regulator
VTVDVDAPRDEVLRVLADPVRWRIVELLAAEELCVCHLVEELDIGQSLVSHHLRALREAGLVDGEKFRYWTYYRLRREAVARLAARLSALAARPRRGSVRRPCC